MCGIAGFLGRSTPEPDRIDACLEIMKIRGPDGLGRYDGRLGENRLLLLHSRLAIIDLDHRSDQPMESDDCVVVFNGEIYNYLEVREELQERGHRFRTEGDTEVIVKAYREWGDAFVDRLEGMWAVALFDVQEQRLVFSRDPFGEKPLYTMTTRDGLYFASEVKFLRILSGRTPSIDHERVRNFLAHGYRSVFRKPGTFFTDVRQFPAAGVAAVRAPETPAARCYWRPQYNPREMSLEEAEEGVRERLFEAVGIRLRADVPVALTLSGGIDSNVLAGIAVKHFGQDLHTFSMLEWSDGYDERPYIDRAVQWLGAPHHEKHVSSNGFIERLGRMVHHYDGPVLTVGMYLEGFLAESVHDAGFKLALCGNGSDEFFLGYYDHYLYWLAGMKDDPSYGRLVEDWRGSLGRWVRNPILQDPDRFVRNPAERGHLHLNAPNVQDFLIEPVSEVFPEERFCEDLLRNRMLNEMIAESVPVLLYCGDLNWMYYSIENRTAYLDRRLVDFVFSVPSRHLIHDGLTKYLLRRAGAGLVPPDILSLKQKFGFNAPITSLLDRTDDDVRDFLLFDSPLFDIVRRDRIEEILKPDTPLSGLDNFLFCFASARLFYDTQRG